MGLREFAEHLAAKALAGRFEDIEAMRLYLLEGLSPSEVAERLGLSKHAVRGRVRRAIDDAGSQVLAAHVLRRLYHRLLKVEHALVWDSRYGYVCMLCRRAVGGRPHQHLYMAHRDLVEALTEELIKELNHRVG
ncbi:MAG: hypothetical protein LM564_06065 [Desulfurococcaceae archaeon]|nr:hypothetical protein [Desulfurococcaceae archaeon]